MMIFITHDNRLIEIDMDVINNLKMSICFAISIDSIIYVGY
jgi:hypothetical protein